ncbi:YCF48-related protein [Flagellatimonas centrodinii]|uniref:WD40/YVTN/BNR-like repeat-containing protein n=1 Tax=Flagellatimonas centrodinii TaxID=2806210 RepID=UPI001FED5F6F|nr:YCF48-related protein [Flagellatimonas centrodinii]ULQ45341.1 YCF48-related protein [Flagellatimonas centrodinii]
MRHMKGVVGGLLLSSLVLSATAVTAQEEITVKLIPRPAQIMPLADESLLLDVVNTGKRLVAVGDRGHILLSADGNEWAQTEVPVRAALTAVAFADDGEHGWAVGHDATIVHTRDGGRQWTLQHFDPELEKPFLDLQVFDAGRVLAVGAYGLMMETTDGGETWTEVEAPVIRDEEVHFNSITRLNSGALFIAGELGMLAFSTDDGETWTRMESPYESSFFGAVPAGENGVLVFGLRGTLYRNDDPVAQPGVDGWQTLENENVATMFGGTRLDDGRVALVGLNGVVTLVDGQQVSTYKSARGTPLSAAIEFGDGLLSVGESGVQRAALTN